MLHIAPEKCIATRLRARKNIDYLSADIASPGAMVKMDITDIHFPAESFDVIYASHVLEHVPDDRKAMRELHRVLRRGGWAVLQVPVWRPTTNEDPTVTDPNERERLFGQSDHVRMYGHDGEYERRLARAGFDVTVEPFVNELGPETRRRYRLSEVGGHLLLHEARAAGSLDDGSRRRCATSNIRARRRIRLLLRRVVATCR